MPNSFTIHGLLNSKAVLTNGKTMEDLLSRSNDLMQDIHDRHGDIYSQVERIPELDASIDMLRDLRQDLEQVLSKCKLAQANVDSVNDDLSICVSLDSSEFVTKCKKLGNDAGPLLMRLNQLYFKDGTIPSFTPEETKRFRKDMGFSLADIPKSTRTEGTLTAELESQRKATRAAQKETKALVKSNADLRDQLQENKLMVESLKENLEKEREAANASIKEIETSRDFLQGQANRLVDLASRERTAREKLVDELAKMQDKYDALSEKNSELSVRLQNVTISEDNSNSNLDLFKWLHNKEVMDRQKDQADAQATQDILRRSLEHAQDERDISERRYRDEIKNFKERLSKSKQDKASWKNTAEELASNLSDTKQEALRLSKALAAGTTRENALSDEIKNLRNQMASSEAAHKERERKIGTDKYLAQHAANGYKTDATHFQKSYENVLVLKDELEQKLEKQLQDARATITRLNAEASTNERNLERAKVMRRRFSRQATITRGLAEVWENSAKSKTLEIDNMQTSLDKKTKELRQVDFELDEARKQNAQYQQTKEETWSKVQEATNALTLAVGKLDETELRLQAELDNTKQNLNKEIEKHEATRQAAQKKIDEGRQLLEESAKGFGDRTENLAQMFNEALERRDRELHDVRERYDELMQQRSQLTRLHETELTTRQAAEQALQTKQGEYRRLQNRFESHMRNIQKYFDQICFNAESHDMRLESFVEGLQSEYRPFSGPKEMEPQWQILDSWTSMNRDIGLVLPADASIEAIILHLVQACCRQYINTNCGQALIRSLTRAVGTCPEIQPNLLVQLTTIFLKTVQEDQQPQFGVCLAFWQMMKVIENRWCHDFTPAVATGMAWQRLCTSLEHVMETKTPYKTLFCLIKLDQDLVGAMHLPVHHWGSMSMVKEPSWPQALVIDSTDRSMRFFDRERLMTGHEGLKIEPLPGQEAIILGSLSEDVYMWLFDLFWADE